MNFFSDFIRIMELERVKLQLIKFLLILLQIVALQLGNFVKADPDVSFCLSSRPCTQICPTNSRDFKISVDALKTTSYCFFGRCFCPINQIRTCKCIPATIEDAKICGVSNNLNPSISPNPAQNTMLPDGLSICRVNSRHCSTNTKVTKYYCVFSIQANGEIPSAPSIHIPTISIPVLGTNGINTGNIIGTGKSETKNNITLIY